MSIYAEASRKNVKIANRNRAQPATTHERVAEREKTLVQRAIKHDHEAFAQLYDRFVDKIYKYIYYKIGSKTEAEDLTGQVFLKAWEAIGHYQYTERPFAAWLYRIAHNLIVDHFRTKRDATSLDDITSLEHPGTDLDEIVDHHLTAESLRRALKRLTRDQQQVIILRFLEGYNTAEVAEMMGKQPGAIRTLQHRALAGLNVIFRAAPEQA
jgi:RNA polymerase sigma-70 factor (ECF subfamily)